MIDLISIYLLNYYYCTMSDIISGAKHVTGQKDLRDSAGLHGVAYFGIVELAAAVTGGEGIGR